MAIEPGQYGTVGAQILGHRHSPTFIKGEEDIPKPSSGKLWDIVYASEVLEHIPEPSTFAKLLYDSVSNDGLIIATTPNVDYVKHEIAKGSAYSVTTIQVLALGQHCCLFTPQSLKHTFERMGCHVRVISPAAGLPHRQIVVASKQNAAAVNSVASKLEAWPNGFADIYRKYLQQLCTIQGSDALRFGAHIRLLAQFLNEGEPQNASQHVQSVLQLEATLQESEQELHADSIANFLVGQWHQMLGDYANSKRYYSRTLDIVGERKGKYHSIFSLWPLEVEVEAHLARAIASLETGDFAQAKSDALSVLETNVDADVQPSLQQVTRARMIFGLAHLNEGRILRSLLTLFTAGVARGPEAKEARRLLLVALRRLARPIHFLRERTSRDRSA